MRESSPNLDEGIPGRRSTLQNKIENLILGYINLRYRKFECNGDDKMT